MTHVEQMLRNFIDPQISSLVEDCYRYYLMNRLNLDSHSSFMEVKEKYPDMIQELLDYNFIVRVTEFNFEFNQIQSEVALRLVVK